MKLTHTLSFRIQALSIGLVLAISAAFLAVFITETKKANMQSLENLAEVTINYLNANVQAQLAKSIDLAAYAAANAPLLEGFFNEAQGKEFIKKMLDENSDAYEIYYGTTKSRFSGGFFITGTDWDPYRNDTTGWDQIKRGWFKLGLEKHEKVNITEPYIDASTGKFCITMVKAVKDDKKTIKGVLGVDMFLTDLTNLINSHKVTEDGSSYLVNKDGVYITHEDQKQVLERNIFEDLDKTEFPKEKVFGNKATTIFGKENFVVSAPVGGTDWFLVSTGSLTSLDKSSLLSIFVVIGIFILIAISVSMLVGTLISGEIKKAVKAIDTVSDGDLTIRLDTKGKNEIANMGARFNIFIDKLLDLIKGIGNSSSVLSNSSKNLSSAASQLENSANGTVAKSDIVANTIEQMAMNINAMASGAEQASHNANDVASAAEQMSTNMNTIASAIEQMGISISEIADNTNEVRKVASEATGKATDATDAMSKLGAAAKEIGQVTDVIKKIADKTNLLALNATIEAASAGEAGKGFAVVAGEIKELANQSAESADDIARRINGIQAGTGNAVQVINDVNDIIIKINQSVEVIANHAEQQTKASHEVAHNAAQANTGAKRVASAINEVAKGVNDVSRNASEAARGTIDVSHNVVDMNHAARESSKGASQVNQSANELSQMAGQLRTAMDKFKV